MPKYKDKTKAGLGGNELGRRLVHRFLEERTIKDEEYFEYSSDLYAAYLAYCEEEGNGIVPLSHRGFALALGKTAGVRSKVIKYDGRVARGYHSVRLLEGVG